MRARPIAKHIGYNMALVRVRCVKGSAPLYACVSFGVTAVHWALKRDAPLQHGPDPRSGKLHYWSGDTADYEPMCVRCHYRHDREWAKERAAA